MEPRFLSLFYLIFKTWIADQDRYLTGSWALQASAMVYLMFIISIHTVVAIRKLHHLTLQAKEAYL